MKRSKFSLSNYKLLTMDMGKLIPISWFEALPGDSIQQATSCLIRVSPLLAPVMHPVRVRLHHWFVPNRLIWEDWEDFITGGDDGNFTATTPRFELSAVAEGSLYDYIGVPVDAAYSPDLDVSALPIRAYNAIYNTHYRDQDLVTELVNSVASGADVTSNTAIQNVSWEKDYFTTARPWEQKGDQVTIPLGEAAPVSGIGPINQTYVASNVDIYETDASGTRQYTSGRETGGTNQVFIEEDPNSAGYPNIRADLSAATGIPINDLRLALAIQRYKEARAQYGSRYVEYLRYLGVRSSDARLQNPEYLGGGRQVIQFSEVLQTAEGTDPVGEMRGHGISAMRTNRYRRFFEEHGIVMTLMSVIPKTIYSQGLNRAFSREVKEDYFQKELQFIGEQEVLNKELYTSHASPDDVFGYQARYDEYRNIPSSIAGEFRSVLDHWHYARIFASDPALNQSFIDAVPTKRVNASTNTDCLYVMANHSIQARRGLSRTAKAKTF